MLDFCNGRNLRCFLRSSTDIRLPNWIAQSHAFADDIPLTRSYAPYSAESKLPAPGSYCADSFTDLGPCPPSLIRLCIYILKQGTNDAANRSRPIEFTTKDGLPSR